MYTCTKMKNEKSKKTKKKSNVEKRNEASNSYINRKPFYVK